MKLTLDTNEINEVLLAWAQKRFPEGNFNAVQMETYTYDPKVIFSHEEPADEAL
jgi:hypothetical protein